MIARIEPDERLETKAPSLAEVSACIMPQWLREAPLTGAAARGRCYEAALRAILGAPVNADARLVHGIIHATKTGNLMGHAWIEIRAAGMMWAWDATVPMMVMPRDAFYAHARIEDCLRYTQRQAAARVIRHNSRCGPWVGRFSRAPHLEDINTKGGVA